MDNLLIYGMIFLALLPFMILVKIAFVVVALEDTAAKEWIRQGAKSHKLSAPLLEAPELVNLAVETSHDQAA